MLVLIIHCTSVSPDGSKRTRHYTGGARCGADGKYHDTQHLRLPRMCNDAGPQVCVHGCVRGFSIGACMAQAFHLWFSKGHDGMLRNSLVAVHIRAEGCEAQHMQHLTLTLTVTLTLAVLLSQPHPNLYQSDAV